MRRRERDAAGFKAAGAPGWMVTYGDLITQVLCFFILLYSFSVLDEDRFHRSVLSVREAFGVLKGGERVTGSDPMSLALEPLPNEQVEDSLAAVRMRDLRQLESLKARIEAAVARRGLQDGLHLIIEERGLVMRFSDSALFDLGRADLRPEALPYLEEIGRELAWAPNHVRVEGHTDSLPIAPGYIFPTNWELSGARAAVVLRYLADHHPLSPDRLSLAGYGEHRPVAANDSEQGRQQNRRVDVVALPLSHGWREPD